MLMQKTSKVLTLVSLALLSTNIIMGTSYVIDKNHFERELYYKDKIIKNNYTKYKTESGLQEAVINELERTLDDQSKIIDAKSSEIHNLKQQLEKSMNDSESPMRQLNVEVTAYTAKCKGCSGFTYTGLDVRNTIEYEGRRIIATNFSNIPLYSIVRIDTEIESFEAVVLDTGGAMRQNSNVIDLLVESYDEAIQFGRQDATVTILKEGKS